MSFDEDPRSVLARSPMKGMQVVVVVLCVLLTALDGFDVLSISFASPGIAAEWGIDRAALGLVLSMELFGMSVGSITLGHFADRIGRRPTILICLVIMTIGMGSAIFTTSILMLSIVRLITGVGIGGMLASTNAMAAEFANDRWRSFAVTAMAAGYPIGAIVGGALASMLLVDGNWRDVFVLGTIMTALMLPLTWFLLPESIDYLMQKKQQERPIARINAVLKRLGHATVTRLAPPQASANQRGGVTALFSGAYAGPTILLTLAYFTHIMTFYFILKWIPKIVVDMGYAPSEAGAVLVAANIGGLAGAFLLGIFSLRISTRLLVIGAMAASVLAVIYFGLGQSELAGLSFVAAVVGFCTNAGVVGLYALIAQAYPASLRAGGTGLIIGIGRGGAALGPVIAGLLFTLGYGLGGVSVAMAAGSLIAAAAIFALRPARQSTDP
ncbi:MFS transporter [Pseudokordiimonas caeni]|uniref:MFS transporter n=1 Tax=Pseudokordiimonas caeni TaxID=2997908 RepID=UPI0028119768|nr:MFS transporter [Pseudokordiimonas caeni]